MENGTYGARPTGQVHVGDHKNGCLICNMTFAFTEDGSSIQHTFWMTKLDGSINTRTIDTLKEIFGWDGSNPFWLEEHGAELAEIDVELVVENETFLGGDGVEHQSLKIKWVNAVGGSGGNQIANGDRKALMAKYGAKLRANSGGVPAAVAKKSPPAKAPAPKQLAPPEPSDIDSCWGFLTESTSMKGKTQDAHEDKWNAVITSVHGNKDQTTFTPQDWGAVMAAIKTQCDDLPY